MKHLRIPYLSRGGRIVRNFIAAMLFIVFAWGFAGFPLSDPYLSYRRAERANWVGPSEIQGTFETRYDTWTFGTYEDQILLHCEDDGYFNFWQRRCNGPELVPIPEGRIQEGEVWIAAVDVPENTGYASLSMNLTCYYHQRMNGMRISAIPAGNCPEYFDHTYVVDGLILSDGGAVFHVTGEFLEGLKKDAERSIISYAYDWDTYIRAPESRVINCSMQAVFYDESGNELGCAQLSTRE